MTDEQVLKSIDKIIKKTKEHSLKWKSMQDNLLLMNRRSINLDSAYISLPSSYVDDISNGYYTNFDEGFIFLIPFRDTDTSSIFPANIPLNGLDVRGQREIALRIQPSKNAYYSQIATTTHSNSDINIQLKRLYTIVEDSVSNIDSFIDSLLNS